MMEQKGAASRSASIGVVRNDEFRVGGWVLVGVLKPLLKKKTKTTKTTKAHASFKKRTPYG